MHTDMKRVPRCFGNEIKLIRRKWRGSCKSPLYVFFSFWEAASLHPHHKDTLEQSYSEDRLGLLPASRRVTGETLGTLENPKDSKKPL